MHNVGTMDCEADEAQHQMVDWLCCAMEGARRFAVNREIFTPLKFSDLIGKGFSVFNSRMSNLENIRNM